MHECEKLKLDYFENRAEGGGSTCSPLNTLRNQSPAGPSELMSYGYLHSHST